MGFGLQSCNKEDNNGDNNGGGGAGGDTVTVKWVDLGLPSGLLWADRNVGAKSPEDYGNYYAWGETTPKEFYDWSTYAYSNALGAFTKYCSISDYGLNGFTDSLTTLEASDDAATVNLGNSARMPKKDEWKELMDNTSTTWTTRNGVYGRLLTGFNGNSIFLPAAGYRITTSLYNTDEGGYYGSSSLCETIPDCEWTFYFYSYTQDLGDDYRKCGFSVRAVRASQN